MNKQKNGKPSSPDVRESRLLGRDGKAAGIAITDKTQAIRSLLN